jgi:hypothetical protein
MNSKRWLVKTSRMEVRVISNFTRNRFELPSATGIFVNTELDIF